MRRLTAVAILLVLLAWIGLPVVRAAMMVEARSGAAITASPNLPVHDVGFAATDGVSLRGWLAQGNERAAAIILVSGFKSDRMDMVRYARFLTAAGYTVLLYDSRGTGDSGGHFTVG